MGVLLALGVQATGRCCVYSDDSETQIHVKLSVLKKQGYLAQRRLTGQGFTDLLREEAFPFLELMFNEPAAPQKVVSSPSLEEWEHKLPNYLAVLWRSNKACAQGGWTVDFQSPF